MESIPSQIRLSIKGALRISQTSRVVSSEGIRWVLGERIPLPKLLRNIFEQLGSTYIKLGQFIASAPSLFPEEYVKEFESCLDKTEELPYKYIKKTIERELGQPIHKVYSWVDKKPLATASIAQVHAAKLITGEDVVIKIQKPGVRNILLTDFNFLLVTTRILERFIPELHRASIGDILSDIQKSMLEECDFLNEAKNLKTFAKFLQDTENFQVVCPKVYDQATTLKILTMERFYGVPLTDLESIEKNCDDPKATLLIAMNTWFQSLMMCEFFHADVHAGNLMVLEDGRVAYIDFGIVGKIRPSTWQAVTEFVQGSSMRNYPLMAKSMVTIGMTKEDVNLDQFAGDIEKIFTQVEGIDNVYAVSNGPQNHDVNQILLDMVSVGRDHGIRFPREFALLIKQFLYFDRYVQILAPEMDMFLDEDIIMAGTQKLLH